MPKKISEEEIKERLWKVWGDIVELDFSTYRNTHAKARFIDRDYGEWWSSVKSVTRGHGCRERGNFNRIQTTLDRYNVINVSQIEEVKEKKKETCIKNHGNENPLQNKSIMEKVKQTNLKKYGVEYFFQSDECKERREQLCLELHGCENFSQADEIKEKKRQTNLEKRGVGCSFQSEEVKEKGKNTCLERYGVENPTQNPEIALKAARSQKNSYIRYHWKTNEEIICQGGWEPKVVEYLNEKKIDFKWQSRTFDVFVDGKWKTYRPDLYLIDENLWIEIKGRKRDLAMKKYIYFHDNIMLNSELWDKEKLKKMKIL